MFDCAVVIYSESLAIEIKLALDRWCKSVGQFHPSADTPKTHKTGLMSKAPSFGHHQYISSLLNSESTEAPFLTDQSRSIAVNNDLRDKNLRPKLAEKSWSSDSIDRMFLSKKGSNANTAQNNTDNSKNRRGNETPSPPTIAESSASTLDHNVQSFSSFNYNNTISNTTTTTTTNTKKKRLRAKERTWVYHALMHVVHTMQEEHAVPIVVFV